MRTPKKKLQCYYADEDEDNGPERKALLMASV